MSETRDSLLSQLDTASLFTILIPNKIILRQCTVLMNRLYLPVGFTTRTISGYFTRLNFDDTHLILEKKTPYDPVYYYIDSQRQTIDGPISYEDAKQKRPALFPLKELRDFPWYDIDTTLRD